jgi:hypothetical protein
MSRGETKARWDALQREWSQALWSRIQALSVDPTIRGASELVRRAWADCAAANPVLRRQLDTRRDELVA